MPESERNHAAPSRRWPLIVVSAVALLALIAPATLAVGEGQPLDGGARNPSSNSSKAYSKETEIIAKNGTYGTRQSNKKDGDGGGAIYGCRSAPGKEPCLRANNLKNGRAFEFNTVNGTEGGQILVNGTAVQTNVVPFTTNAAGRVENLNADKVDGFDAAGLRAQAAAVSSAGALGRNNGATAASRTAAGEYQVTFGSDVSACFYQATLNSADTGDPVPGEIGTAQGSSANNVKVVTFDNAGAKADRAFQLTVNC